MKNFKGKKILYVGLSLLIAGLFFIIGKGNESESMQSVGEAIGYANVGIISLSEAEKAGFNDAEKKMLGAMEKLVNQVNTKAQEGLITKEELAAFKTGVIETLKNDELKALQDELKKLDDVAKAQGTSLATMENKLAISQGSFKSIAEVLAENKEELQKVYSQGSGNKQFMVTTNNKGEFVMKPFDPTKAAGPHASAAGVGGETNTSSITQTLDAATLLRLGGNSPIISNYRNNSWVFDLVNVTNSGFDQMMAMWYEEIEKQGSSANVSEGATKPKTQYAYQLKSSSWKKEATLLGFTEEFNLDFARLQSDIVEKGRIDVINRINAEILANITTNATAYNTAASFIAGGAVAGANDFDAIAALAAQVDNATYGSMANTAVMSTFKKYRMGITKDDQAAYLNRPAVLDNIAFIGNPDVAADALIVGDMKAYNVILRGGFIVRIGYNGTDFAENRFSMVMEQFYFDYIANIRKKAIVKGPDFATVKLAIGTA